MGSNSSTLAFDILARDRGASRTFNTVGRSAGRAGGAVQRAGKLAKAGALGLVSGAAALGLATVKLTKNAMQDEAAARRLAKALRNTTGATRVQVSAVEDWISKQGVALGVTDDELRPAMNRLVTATHNITKAQKDARLAMDISAGTGKNLEVVSMALAKAENGNVSALGRLGLKVKDATGKTKSLHAITKDLAKTYGGQARAAANSAQGKFERLKLILDETGESIGYKLLPPLVAVATWILNKGIPAVGRFGQWFRTNLVPPLRQAGEFITTRIVPAFQRFDVGAAKSSSTVREFGRNFSSIITSVRSIMGSLSSFAQAFWAKYGDLITRFGVGTLRNFITQLRGMMNIVTGIFKTVAAILRGDWRGAWNGIKQIARGGMQVVRAVISQGWNVIKTVFQAGGRALGQLMGVAWEGVKRGVSAGIRAAVRLVTGLPGKITAAIGDLSTLLLHAGEQIISGLIAGIGKKSKDLVGKLKGVTNLIPKVKGPIDKDRQLLTPAGVAIMEGLIHGIKSRELTVKKVLGKVTSYVEALGSKLSSLKDLKAEFLGTFTGSSVFGADLSGGGGVGALLTFSQQQNRRAEQLQRDVQTLVSAGLSKALILQMRQQGDSGVDQIHALAGATPAQIAQINALDKATTAALQAAGLIAGNGGRGGNIDTDIAKTQRDLALAQAIERALSKMKLQAHIHLEGKELVTSVRVYNRKRGRKPGDFEG